MYRNIPALFGSQRKGAAVVELAIVLPLFALLVIGTIDVGRAIIVRHTLVEAARTGCRLHAVKGEVAPAQVTAAIDAIMDDADLNGYTVTFDPQDSSGIEQLQPVRATVSIPYDEVSWLPTSWFLAGRTLTGTCVMPGDTGELIATLN
jgi:Flp pilus assembly protein TadG